MAAVKDPWVGTSLGVSAALWLLYRLWHKVFTIGFTSNVFFPYLQLSFAFVSVVICQRCFNLEALRPRSR